MIPFPPGAGAACQPYGWASPRTVPRPQEWSAARREIRRAAVERGSPMSRVSAEADRAAEGGHGSRTSDAPELERLARCLGYRRREDGWRRVRWRRLLTWALWRFWWRAP